VKVRGLKCAKITDLIDVNRFNHRGSTNGECCFKTISKFQPNRCFIFFVVRRHDVAFKLSFSVFHLRQMDFAVYEGGGSSERGFFILVLV